MEITDKEVKKEIKKINSITLNMRIRDLEEEERDNRTDMEILETELEWAIEDFEDDGHQLYVDLKESESLLKETKHGRVIPLDEETLKPKKGYTNRDIQYARDTVCEYNRLKRGLERVRESKKKRK